MSGSADRFPAMKNERKGRQISGSKEWAEEQTDFRQKETDGSDGTIG